MHIVLSPHYDDAIYSCGGTLYALHQRGERAVMFTLMAGSVPQTIPDTPIVRENHARWEAGHDPVPARREEDAAAAHIVGAETHYADIPDCIYRTVDGTALYPDVASLFGNVSPNDPALATLNALHWPFPEATMIYAPLGVGGHVDHKIVRAWAQRLHREHRLPLRYYADYPYWRDQPGAIAAALMSLLNDVQPHNITLPQAALNAKIDAMAAYRSQIKTFWDDEAALRRDVPSDFSDGLGRHVERYWEHTQ